MADIKLSVIDQECTGTPIMDSSIVYVRVQGQQKLLKVTAGKTVEEVVSAVATRFSFPGGFLVDNDDEEMMFTGTDAVLGGHVYNFYRTTSVQEHAAVPLELAKEFSQVSLRLGRMEEIQETLLNENTLATLQQEQATLWLGQAICEQKKKLEEIKVQVEIVKKLTRW